jgi:hypothetical protein
MMSGASEWMKAMNDSSAYVGSQGNRRAGQPTVVAELLPLRPKKLRSRTRAAFSVGVIQATRGVGVESGDAVSLHDFIWGTEDTDEPWSRTPA